MGTEQTRSTNKLIIVSVALMISGLLMLQGCSRMALLNAPIPTHDLQIHRGISFDPNPRLALNVYEPKSPGPHPVVVFFYGGKWEFGERGQYLFLAQSLAAKGYLTVIPDYRLYPEVKYPDFLHDTARAVQWTTNNIEKYGGNPDQLFLMGHSAGAYNVSMVSLNPRYLSKLGVNRDRIKGTIGLAGPYDFKNLKEDTVVKSIFGTVNPIEKTYVTRYAKNVQNPFLLMVGKKDETVGQSRTKRFARALRQHGGDVTTHYYSEANHVGMILPFAYPMDTYPFGWNEPLTEDVDRFIQRVLTKGQP